MTITFAIVAAIVVLFVWDRLPVVVVAMATALALWATGVLDLGQALAGFGDPAVIFIASLFVVSAGLEATGVTAWTGQVLIAQAGESRARLLTLTMLLVAVLTALINLNGAVAALLPVAVVMAVRLGRPPSQLLMPLVFAGHAGSLLALTGTPVNVLVSDAVVDAGQAPFRYFEFGYVGLPLLLGTMAIIVLVGQRLLPERSGRTIPADLSKHARTLIEHYTLDDGIFQLRVRSDSPYRGAPQAVVDFTDYPGLTLVAIQAADEGGPLRRPTLAEGDVLIVRGEAHTVASLSGDKHLALRAEDSTADVTETLFNRKSGLAEVVIPPRSGFIGQTVFPGTGVATRVRNRGGGGHRDAHNHRPRRHAELDRGRHGDRDDDQRRRGIADQLAEAGPSAGTARRAAHTGPRPANQADERFPQHVRGTALIHGGRQRHHGDDHDDRRPVDRAVGLARP